MTDPSSTAFARSRQKNCNQCVLVKRRCDRQTPVCGRCVEKSLVCSWSRNRKVVGQPRHDTSGQPFAFTGSPMLEVPTSHVLSSAQPPNFDYLEDTDLGAATAPTLPAEDYLMGDLVEDGLHTDPFLEMLCKSLHPTQEQWMVSVGAGAPTERPSTPVDEEIMRSYAKIAPSCIDMQPWHLYDPNTPLYYISHRVKGFVSDIASRNAAPFLHHKLYRSQTPPCILTCFTVAVLYTNRTQTNTMMVMQAIHQNADTLVGSEASRPSATPVEKLARTQALFVYQIIQLMDGDVSLRVKGERNLPLLQKWLEELCTVRENLRDLAPMDNLLIRQQPPQEWERWIFAESVRRTIITGLSFLKLYELMKAPKEEDREVGIWAYAHRWTMSRHLWEADSPFEFDRAWKEMPHFIITNFTLENFMKYGRPQDVDELGEIMLSIYMGVDAAREFMSTSREKRHIRGTIDQER